MIEEYQNGILFLKFENLTEAGVPHFISTRMGGVSQPPYDSLNIGFHTEDLFENVIENRKRLAEAAGTEINSMVFAGQVHQTKVHRIEAGDAGRGAKTSADAMGGTDAFLLSGKEVKGITPVIQTADCLPVLFYDPQTGTAAVAHSGWKGTVGKISAEVIKAMKEYAGVIEKDILVGIGPGIGECCYEVGGELIGHFQRNGFNTEEIFHKKDGHLYLDIKKAVQQTCLFCGIPKNQIEISNHCTFCRKEEFYSHRRDHGRSGRQAAGIRLT